MNRLPEIEASAGVVAFRQDRGESPLYLLIHSATVRDSRARWEFPKGRIELGETARAAAAREFIEETGLISWSMLDGFERRLSYLYRRQGLWRFKVVAYFIGEVFDASSLTRSLEHVEDAAGDWNRWRPFAETYRCLYHKAARELLVKVDAWLARRRKATLRSSPDGSNQSRP